MKTFPPRALMGALALAAACLATAQTAPPATERSGATNQVLASVALPVNFDMANGRTLRMREVTIAPGGVLRMHEHLSRPSVSYVLKGTLTEQQEGDSEPRTLVAGQAYSTYLKGHALQNRGDVPVVFVEIDLPVP